MDEEVRYPSFFPDLEYRNQRPCTGGDEPCFFCWKMENEQGEMTDVCVFPAVEWTDIRDRGPAHCSYHVTEDELKTGLEQKRPADD